MIQRLRQFFHCENDDTFLFIESLKVSFEILRIFKYREIYFCNSVEIFAQECNQKAAITRPGRGNHPREII